MCEPSEHANEYFGQSRNKKWSGYRSDKYSERLTHNQMVDIHKDLVALGCNAHMVTLKAGDSMAFDGR